jgi:hypothetical protein
MLIAPCCDSTCSCRPSVQQNSICSAKTHAPAPAPPNVLCPAVPPGGPANRDPVEADLPILGFGPWTYPQTQNGCQYNFNTDSTSDAWPYGLCTLKRVPDTKKLKYAPPTKAAPQRQTGGQKYAKHGAGVALGLMQLSAAAAATA